MLTNLQIFIIFMEDFSSQKKSQINDTDLFNDFTV